MTVTTYVRSRIADRTIISVDGREVLSVVSDSPAYAHFLDGVARDTNFRLVDESGLVIIGTIDDLVPNG